MSEIERRTSHNCELRAQSEAGEMRLAGYAAVFGSRSEDLGGFVEVIDEGAFSDALAGDVRALFNHDPNLPLGRTTNGTLKLKQDSRGLWMEVALPNTTYARDLYESVKRGDVTEQSFGFRVVKESWGRGKDGIPERRLQAVQLVDVSPVVFPAYQATAVSVRQRALDIMSNPNSGDADGNNRLRQLDLLALE